MRIEANLQRLRAAQEMIQMVWSCANGAATVQSWVLSHKVGRLFSGFSKVVYSASGELVVARYYDADAAGRGLEHWVAHNALSFGSEFVG